MIKRIKLTETNKEHLPWYIDSDVTEVTIIIPSIPWFTIYLSTIDSEGVVSLHMENRKVLDDRVTKAYNAFMTRLFGEVPKNPSELTVDKELYTKEMQDIQEHYGLKQGDPEFLEWVLTLVGRSPVLTSEGEIVYDTGTKGHPARENETMGETPPSQAE